uniref:Glucose-6-phosphate exchanger SLC37A2 n=1 Tax=Strigops habroptila TaxID=2489341 RepID=A0A672V815_STRHB
MPKSSSLPVGYRGLTLVLTFLCYTSYHLSRKPISIVKVGPNLTPTVGRRDAGVPRSLFPSHTSLPGSWFPSGWGKQHPTGCWDPLGIQAPARCDDTSPVTGPIHALTCLHSGIFGERLPLRYYLSGGMVLSGLFTALFGLGYFWNIHVLWYFIIMQVCNGLVQTTGWPSVVACVGNWFGKGKRGLIMGIWNSHTSVGNILGSLIAGVWVSSAWGLSFIVPGIIIAAMGIICFFFLVECEWCDPGCTVTSNEGPLSTSGQSSTDRLDSPKEAAEEPEAISFLGALRIPGVVEFSLCLLFAKLVSYTFLYWLPLYIVNVAHFGAKKAGDLSTLFDVGGILGGIFAGLISDYTGGRATTCCVMLILAAPVVPDLLPFLAAMLIVCGALVNGPYALITTAVSADLGTHESLKGNAKALSTVTAIIDGTGSIGAALGPLLAGLISPTGWNNVFYMLIAADVLACLVGPSSVGITLLPWVFKSSLLATTLVGGGQGWSLRDSQAQGKLH